MHIIIMQRTSLRAHHPEKGEEKESSTRYVTVLKTSGKRYEKKEKIHTGGPEMGVPGIGL